MFAKNRRLSRDRDIKKVFAIGRSAFNPYFTVKYLISGNASRFTVVVSTKVFKKAVERNRLKRLVREILKKYSTVFLPGDYAIIAKPAASKLSETERSAVFERLVKERLVYEKNSRFHK